MSLLLIDLSSIAHQVSKGSSELKTSAGVNTGHIYSVLRKIESIKKLQPKLIVFCLDAGHEERDEVSNTYKANRGTPKTKSKILDLIPALKCFPVALCAKRGCEADDILYTLACLMHKENVIVLSKDYDISVVLFYYPLVRHFFTLSQEITPTSLFIKYGCLPEHLPLHKAIFGDDSDNIKGVKLGKGKRNVLNLLSEGKIKEVMAKVPKDLLPTVSKNLKLTKPRFLRGIKIAFGNSNEQELKTYLSKYEISSLNARELLNDFPFNAELLDTLEKRIG